MKQVLEGIERGMLAGNVLADARIGRALERNTKHLPK